MLTLLARRGIANLLLASGKLTARLPPTLQQMWDRLSNATELDVVRAWADLRSPSAPVLLSQLAVAERRQRARIECTGPR